MASDCIFCRIAAGTLEAEIVSEDEHSLAFLDHRPLFPGHCLLIPRAHIETLPQLPAPLAGPFLMHAQLLCTAVEEAMQAAGTFVAVNNRVSQSVPHLHLHVVPRRPKDGLKGFFWPRHRYDDAEAMRTIQNSIRQSVRRLLAHKSPQ